MVNVPPHPPRRQRCAELASRMRMAGITVGMAICVATAAHAQRAPSDTVAFHAASVGRTMKYNIILPAGYRDETNADRHYPTLYLLHGEDSNFQVWRRVLGVPRDALDVDLIIVMPDAGNSFYVNWDQTDDAHVDAWEDYLVEDVVGHVEAHYRALPQREGRAIAGFSMGGYGALVIGLRHPEMFVSVGSQSGTLAYARSAAARLRLGGVARPPQRYTPEVESQRMVDHPDIGLPGFSSISDRTPQGQPFVTSDHADAHDPFMLVMRVPRNQLPFIQIDCGTGDPRLPTAQSFVSLLLDADIPFDYSQRRGGQDTAYWVEAYGYAIALHDEVMQRALGLRVGGERAASHPRG